MQDYVIQATAQPFLRLVQSNMELFTRFSTSPDVAAQAGRLLQQVGESAMSLMQSAAFAQMLQGLLKNYTEFMIEFNQSALSLASQGQAAMARQAQEAAQDAVDMADVRGRRSRQAA
jgi:hypothetical protein